MTDQFAPLTRGGYEYRLLRHPDGSLVVDHRGSILGALKDGDAWDAVRWRKDGLWIGTIKTHPLDLIPIQEP